MDLPTRALFESHPDPMWISEIATRRILAVNPAALTAYGYTPAEFLSLNADDMRLPAPPGEQRPVRQHHRRKSGGVMEVEVSLYPLEYEGLAASLEIARKVTSAPADDADTMDMLLREQGASLRTAQRLLGLGIWHLHLSTGALQWSDNLYALYGVSPDGFGHDFQAYVALVHPGDHATMLENFRVFREAGLADFDFAHRILRPDGRVVHVRGVGELMDEGRILVGVVRDVTREVEGAARLNEANDLLRIASRIGRIGGWRVSLAEGDVEWSPETAEIHDAPELRRVTVEQGLAFYAPEYRERINEVFATCAEKGAPFDEVLQIITARGRRVWVRAIAEAVLAENGRIEAVRGAFQDISELAQARRESLRLAERLGEILESISDAFYTIDNDWRFTFLNSEAERLVRRSRLDLIGRNLLEQFPEVVGSRFQREFEIAIRDRVTRRFTEYFAPLETWFQITACPAPEGLTVYFRDVTRERMDQEELRLLQAAVSRMNDVLLITEAQPIEAPEGPRIVYVNDAFERRTGFTREEAIGRTPRILQGPETQRGELDRIAEALRQWRPVSAEVINHTKAGEPFWLELDIVPLADAKGSYTHWVATSRDISRRKTTEAALRLSEERFRLIARATNDLIWDVDLATGVIWRNENGHALFGPSPGVDGETIEKWTARLHPEDRQRVLDGIRVAIDTGAEVWRDEYRVVRADRRTRLVVDRGFILRDGAGRALRVLGSMLDVTEQREMDERRRQSQKLEAVGQLTGGVAHDFNNLLTIILGNAELLVEELAEQGPLRQMAEMTMTAALRGAELTNRLLAFSRRQALDPKAIHTGRLVTGMEALLRRTLGEHVEISILSSSDLWAAVVDPGQLEVALLNLVINARDAMPGGGRLTIETANAWLDEDYAARNEDAVAGPYAVVMVSDTGSGMPPEIVARAFEPFFTTKEVGRGSGLGLSMVYGFVRQSNGHVKIYSEPDQGTTVRLYLPRAISEDAQDLRRAVEAAVPQGHEHVLAVEDDPLVREHVIGLLRGLGYRVTGAEAGPAAMALLRELTDIDLLFTDVVMPGGMNGAELAQAAQVLRPGIKVLFTSGYSENAIMHHGRLDPGVNLITKPYRRVELALKLRKVLEG